LICDREDFLQHNNQFITDRQEEEEYMSNRNKIVNKLQERIQELVEQREKIN